jgi:MFS family permease
MTAADAVRPEPSQLYRWLVLVSLSSAMFGNYYFYDALTPLADVLQKQLHFSDQNIGLLNSFYSIAPIFTVLIGGIIIDRIGVRKATLLFGVICLVGSVVTAATPSFPIMATGRFIFGMGAESLIVSVTTGLAKWFKGKELSFAFGINMTITRFGTWLAQNSPSWARSSFDSWQKPWWIGVGFVTLCVIGPLIYWFLEVRAERIYTLGHASHTDKIVFNDVRRFGVSYWYLVALCVLFYSGIFSFETFAVKYFIHAHHLGRDAAGFQLSILTACTMVGTPLFGFLSDRIGRRALLMAFGSMLLIPVFLLMAYTQITLYIPMSMLGVAFALVPAIIWPSIAYIVEERTLGTAYGLMTMIENMGMAGVNWLLGFSNDSAHAGADNPDGYRGMLYILTGLGLVSVIFAYLLRVRETGPHGHGLETITTKSKG